MTISISRLRRWFAIAAAAAILVVMGFFFYSRYKAYFVKKIITPHLGANILRSSNGFTYSKSEGGRTLFTIRAAKAEEFTGGSNALLTDVSIIVYGKDSSRFDQISGKGFDYDSKSGRISARGEVDIDLQSNIEGKLRPDQAIPHVLKDPIHLRTTGLVFDQKTGIAETNDLLQMEVPQASGSARGVTYECHLNLLTLHSDVVLSAPGKRNFKLTAASGEVTAEPRQIVLHKFHLEQQGSIVEGDLAEVSIRDNNTVERMVATGNVVLRSTGRSVVDVRAPRAEVEMAGEKRVRTLLFSGGVLFHGSGGNAVNGMAGKVLLHYGAGNQLLAAEAFEHVRIHQTPSTGRQQAVDIISDALDFSVVNGHLVRQAKTRGAAQIVLTPASGTPGEQTVVTAGSFRAEFDDSGHLTVMHGEPNARVTQNLPGAPDRTSTSRLLTVEIAQGGGVYSVIQEGNFRYFEAAHGNVGERRASAARALYMTDDGSLTLSGAPRMTDGGMTVSAQSIRINRSTGDAFAQGGVKSTYNDLKASPDGAMLASSDPVHVTAQSMSVQRASGIARYTGGARLWQGANAVTAQALEFNHTLRSLTADSSGAQKVISVFVQNGTNGRIEQVTVSSDHLIYLDAERRAHFSGVVTARSQGRTIQAARTDVYLKPASAAKGDARSQLQQIIANGSVSVEETGRRITGERLVCKADDGSCVMGGGEPLVVDRQYGNLRGDTLTFYSRDDRVVVGSSGASRTVTHTKAGH